MSVHSKATKVTTHTLQEMKRANEPITMLTAYDYSLARLVDAAGVDVILVGDSASNVMASSNNSSHDTGSYDLSRSMRSTSR